MQKDLASINNFLNSSRFANKKRPYGAQEVARLTPPVPRTYKSAYMSMKLWSLLKEKAAVGGLSHTFGCLDPVQVAQMGKYLSSIYVSGWQSSSTASIINEPGPDLADYPYNTVPNKVDQLYRAQEFHEAKECERAMRTGKPKAVDFMRPIIADADAGHGGVHAMMRVTKLFIEAGASGIHIEDQNQSTKKCGHMGGKVLVSTQTHVDRLVAARLQADICKTPLVIVARTDAEAATQLDNNSDIRDQPFILGCTNPNLDPLQTVLQRECLQGNGDVGTVTKRWREQANLMTYWEAVERQLNNNELKRKWNATKAKLNFADAAKYAASLGVKLYWDMDKPRSREGYYQIRGGLDACIARSLAYAPYCDLLWMETKKPGLKIAGTFARAIKSVYPNQFLAYNCSPSFNWDAAGMNDQEIRDFQVELGKLGFCWQFITLAGFHLDALAVDRFARKYAKEYMLAYVRDIQRKERDENVETLTHQKWSGAEFVDAHVQTVTGGLSSTTAMQHGNTEDQFAAKRSKL